MIQSTNQRGNYTLHCFCLPFVMLYEFVLSHSLALLIHAKLCFFNVHHRKQCSGFRSDERGGHRNSPPRPFHRLGNCLFMVTFALLHVRNAHVNSAVIRTFFIILNIRLDIIRSKFSRNESRLVVDYSCITVYSKLLLIQISTAVNSKFNILPYFDIKKYSILLKITMLTLKLTMSAPIKNTRVRIMRSSKPCNFRVKILSYNAYVPSYSR